jgi:hypothetical protein
VRKDGIVNPLSLMLEVGKPRDNDATARMSLSLITVGMGVVGITCLTWFLYNSCWTVTVI